MVDVDDDLAGVEDTREKILEAAFHLFAQQGYSQTTTRTIAIEAGVNEVTIFRQFGSKQKLLMSLLEQHTEGGFGGAIETKLSGNYVEDILTLARQQIASMRRGFAAMRLMICESATFPEVRNMLLKDSRHNRERLVDYFRQQQRDGVVRPDLDPVLLSDMFDSLFSKAVAFQLLFPDGELPDVARGATIFQMAALFVRGTINQEKKEG